MSKKKKVFQELPDKVVSSDGIVKFEYAVTVTMQFTHAFTQEEVDEGTPISHEFVVAGCVECLANKDYEIQEDDIN